MTSRGHQLIEERKKLLAIQETVLKQSKDDMILKYQIIQLFIQRHDMRDTEWEIKLKTVFVDILTSTLQRLECKYLELRKKFYQQNQILTQKIINEPTAVMNKQSINVKHLTSDETFKITIIQFLDETTLINIVSSKGNNISETHSKEEGPKAFLNYQQTLPRSLRL